MTRFIFLCWKITVTTMCLGKQQSAGLYLDILPLGISRISPWIMRTTRVIQHSDTMTLWHCDTMTLWHYDTVSVTLSQSVKLSTPSLSLSMCQHFDIKLLKYRIYFQVTCSICCCHCQCYFFNLFSFSKIPIIVCHHFNLTFVLNLSLTSV